MTPEELPQASRMLRLLLALDAQDSPQPQIKAAALLAAALGARLEVLLLEDDELHAAAALPIMQEISSASARERELSPARLERALRAISREAEAGFRAAVEDGDGRFRVLRGRRNEALGEAAEGVDLLLLPGRRGVLRFRVVSVPLQRVFAIFGDTPAGERTLDFAGRLARQTGRSLELIVAGAPGATSSGRQPNTARHDFPAGTPLERLLQAADTGPGSTIVLSRDLATADRGRLPAQLASLRCEVLLVS
jgi:hypothetical protein